MIIILFCFIVVLSLFYHYFKAVFLFSSLFVMSAIATVQYTHTFTTTSLQRCVFTGCVVVFCHCLFLISSFGASRRLCFMIVAFLG